MKKLASILLCGVAFVNLAGCQGSAVYYHRDPARQIVVLDQREVSVVPLGNGRWEAFGGKQGGSSVEDLEKQKARQIEAIEKVTACRVTTTEFPPDKNERRLLIQATVVCELPPKR
jgi:hypothetical protein